jgi:hypothetical protein
MALKNTRAGSIGRIFLEETKFSPGFEEIQGVSYINIFIWSGGRYRKGS